MYFKRGFKPNYYFYRITVLIRITVKVLCILAQIELTLFYQATLRKQPFNKALNYP